jgi:hypothetical protein
MFWMSVWILSAAGLQKGNRVALFPVWFFAIASVANGVAHALRAVAAQGYFPGLFTSPILGIFGVLLWVRLLECTRRSTR